MRIFKEIDRVIMALYSDIPEVTPEGEVYHYWDATWASQCLKSLATCSLFNWFLGWRQRKHQCSPLLALCEGNPAVTGEFPSQRASDVWSIFYICNCKCNCWSVHLVGTMNSAGFIAHFATGIYVFFYGESYLNLCCTLCYWVMWYLVFKWH